MKEIGYVYKCKSCGQVMGQSKIPKFDNMPAVCNKCGGSYSVETLYEDNDVAFSYELYITNKNTGANVMGSVALTLNETKLNENELKNVLIKKLSTEFARVVTNPEHLTKLVIKK